MRYRKKPVIIDAFKWVANIAQEKDPKWLIEAINNGTVYFKNACTPDAELIIKTLEGDMRADIGDYIIRGVQDGIYPCKPDIFSQTYDEVNKNLTVNVSVKDTNLFKDIIGLIEEISEKDDSVLPRLVELMSKHDSKYNYSCPCETCDPEINPICTDECREVCPLVKGGE